MPLISGACLVVALTSGLSAIDLSFEFQPQTDLLGIESVIALVLV